MQLKLNHNKLRFWTPIVIALLALISLTRGISGDIYIVDEARNAECAREMLESGNYIVPTYNYKLRTDKPPLHYYFMMASYSLFGVSEWSVRLFSVIFGCLTILISYFFSKRWFGIKAGIWTAIVLLSSIHFSIQFHMSVPDPYLIFFITAALFLFYDALQTQSILKSYLMYTCIALGTLAKGPIAIALPGLIMLLFLIFTKQLSFKNIWKLRPLEGIFIVALIALPWYIAVHQQTNGAWTQGFFFEHNMDRFSNTKEGHGGTFLIAPLFVILGMLPFSAFFIKAIKKAYTNKHNQALLLSLITLFTIVGFFMISSTRLPNYTAPAYPFFAIILSYYVSGIKEYNIKPELIVMVVFAFLLVPAAYFGFQAEYALRPLSKLAVFILPSAIICAIAYLYYIKKKLRLSIHLMALGFFFSAMIISQLMYSNVAASNPVNKTLTLVNNHKHLAYYKKFNQSYPFYLKKQITQLSTSKELRHFLTHSADAMVITQKKRLKDIEYSSFAEIIFEQKDIFEGHTTVILKSLKSNEKLTIQ